MKHFCFLNIFLNYFFCFWYFSEHYKDQPQMIMELSYQNIFYFPFITFRIPQIFIFHSVAFPFYFYFSPISSSQTICTISESIFLIKGYFKSWCATYLLPNSLHFYCCSF